MNDPLIPRIPSLASPLSFGMHDLKAAPTVPSNADEFIARMQQLGVAVIHNTMITDESEELHEKH